MNSYPDKKDILKQHKQHASSLPKKVKIDIEKMNNTGGDARGAAGSSSISFPKIVFEDEKRVQGTADFDSSKGRYGKAGAGGDLK